METDQEAVLDRIRQVEEKVENGIVVTAPQMPAGAPGAQGVPQAGVAKPKPQLPITAEVTPCQPDVVRYGSQKSCAS